MDKTIINNTIAALRHNHFDVFYAENTDEAREFFFRDILPAIQPETVSWGDSLTLKATGIMEELREQSDISIINTFGPAMSRVQKIYWRRQALLADLFLTGSNALTQKGQVVNLDMVGNRVGGIAFGPKNVVLFIGVNKITADAEEAMHRIRTIAAPQNAMRHEGFRTPCHKTGVCTDCNSPDRICNVWTITEKSYPTGRIRIVLINQDVGL